MRAVFFLAGAVFALTVALVVAVVVACFMAGFFRAAAALPTALLRVAALDFAVAPCAAVFLVVAGDFFSAARLVVVVARLAVVFVFVLAAVFARVVVFLAVVFGAVLAVVVLRAVLVVVALVAMIGSLGGGSPEPSPAESQNPVSRDVLYCGMKEDSRQMKESGMDLQWSDEGSEARFASYVEGLSGCLGHADRVAPMRSY